MTYSFIALLWMLLGFGFILVEFFLTGIGLLFLGIGSLLNAILIYNSPKILSHQYTSFGLITLLCFIFLWKPLKKYADKAKKMKHDFNIIGTSVIVVNNKILPGKIGEVKWSGTTMNARLSDHENEPAYIGDVIYVDEIQGNILICRKNQDLDN